MGCPWREGVVLVERIWSWERGCLLGREDLVLGEWGHPGRENDVVGQRGWSCYKGIGHVDLVESGWYLERGGCPGREDLVLGEWGSPGRENVFLGERGWSW